MSFRWRHNLNVLIDENLINENMPRSLAPQLIESEVYECSRKRWQKSFEETRGLSRDRGL